MNINGRLVKGLTMHIEASSRPVIESICKSFVAFTELSGLDVLVRLAIFVLFI
jgi:hypothetical protein